MNITPAELAALLFGGTTDEPGMAAAMTHHLRRPGAPPGNGKLISTELANAIQAADPDGLFLHVETYHDPHYHMLWLASDWRESAERQYLLRVNSDSVRAAHTARLRAEERFIQMANEASALSGYCYGKQSFNTWLGHIKNWYAQADGNEDYFRESCEKFADILGKSIYQPL